MTTEDSAKFGDSESAYQSIRDSIHKNIPKIRKSICVLAGDPSGDIAGFHFLRALKDLRPDIEVFGLGGPRMKSLGQEQFADGADLAALGFWEVARRYLFFRRLFYRVKSEIEQRHPSAVIMIDYPGFNLRLAEKIKHLKIPLIYYIAPQVWAWGAGRIPAIGRLVDRLLVILPFEVEFFKKHGITAEYVGHYLLDDIPEHLIGAAYDPDSRQIALLPGSRQQEVDRMLPVMLEAARALGDTHRFVIAGVSGGVNYDQILARFPEFSDRIVYDLTRQSVAESVLVISSSGTATLEAALIGRPLIVIYKTGWLTFQIAKRLVGLPFVALANIVAGKLVAPEFLQGQASVANIAKASKALLASAEERETALSEWASVRKSLGVDIQRGASEKVAEAVASYL